MVDEGGQSAGARLRRRRREPVMNEKIPAPTESRLRQSHSQADSKSAQRLDRGFREDIVGWRVAAVNGGGVADEGLGISLSATFENGSVQNLLFSHHVAASCLAIMGDLIVGAQKLRDQTSGVARGGAGAGGITGRRRPGEPVPSRP
jgi:hypothetical protein